MTAARPRVLVTSFEPFGASPVNPTVEIARILASTTPAVGTRHYLTLPVVTGDAPGSAWHAAASAIRAFEPDAVVSLGESAKADRIHFERVAINLRDARIPDNSGVQLQDAPIDPSAQGANAYFSTTPMRTMADACESAGVPATLSLSAGAFLCNELLYRLLWRAAEAREPRLRAGFIHVPQLPEQAEARGGPSMSAEMSARGVLAALDQLATWLASDPDRVLGGGTLA